MLEVEVCVYMCATERDRKRKLLLSCVSSSGSFHSNLEIITHHIPESPPPPDGVPRNGLILNVPTSAEKAV